MNCQKHLFSLPEDVVYLNNAYQAPLLKSSEQAGLREIEKKKNPSLIVREDFFDMSFTLRKAYAKLIGAKEADRVAIVTSASYAIATVAANIQVNPKQNIVMAGEQFPSNYYSWRRMADEKDLDIKLVSPQNVKNRGEVWNGHIMDSIDERTAIVAIGNVHWADGTIFKLKEIGEKARSVGAALIIDGTQSIGALPFDIKEIQPDAVICAGYKWLLGPYGHALSWFGPRFDGGRPIEENWINRKDSERFEKLVNYEPEYRPYAQRYSVGESSNFIYNAILTDSIGQIDKWGVKNIQDYTKKLAAPFIPKLQEMGYSVEQDEYRTGHLFGIRMPEGIDVDQVRKSLAAENVFVSVRGNSLRISLHLYNEKKHLESLILALQASK